MDSEHNGDPERIRAEPPRPREPDADESYWQWVALVVLLACWLAEARI